MKKKKPKNSKFRRNNSTKVEIYKGSNVRSNLAFFNDKSCIIFYNLN